MKTTNFLKMAILAVPLMLASCGSKKKVIEAPTPKVVNMEKDSFLEKVNSNAQ